MIIIKHKPDNKYHNKNLHTVEQEYAEAIHYLGTIVPIRNKYVIIFSPESGIAYLDADDLTIIADKINSLNKYGVIR